MSIFTTSVSQLSTADLQELLDDGAVENTRLEFKAQCPPREEMVKKLSSFGNTYGGFLIVGAAEKDGRIQDLPGVDAQPSYKQQIVQWAVDRVSPPLFVEVSEAIPVPAKTGKVCYVVFVPESDIAPHFLNGRKGAWIRTDEFSNKSDLADEADLRRLFDRRKFVRDHRSYLLQRSKNRFTFHIASAHKGSATSNVESLLWFSVIPRFPARQLCAQDNLKTLIESNRCNWRNSTFPAGEKPLLSQHESVIVLEPARIPSIFEANVWGLLFYATSIARKHEDQSFGIRLAEFAGFISLFIEHAGKMLRALSCTGSVLIETKLTDMRDVPWLNPQEEGWLSARAGSVLDNEVEFPINTTAEELVEKPDRAAMEVIQSVLFAANSPTTLDSKNLEAIIRIGRVHNLWPQLDKLRT
jgi:Putative DNA-binding domain